MRNRKRYPKNWRKLVSARREQVGNRCEHCGIVHGTPRLSPWTGNLWPVWLQGAHVNHDPDNPNPELAIVCPRCHWRFYRKPNQIPAWYIEKLKHRKLIARAYCL